MEGRVKYALYYEVKAEEWLETSENIMFTLLAWMDLINSGKIFIKMNEDNSEAICLVL